MTADKLSRFWLLATFLLLLVIFTGGLIIWSQQSEGQAITIFPPRASTFHGEIHVDGAVKNPGSYRLNDNDSIQNIIQASGGANSDANLSQIRLYIPQINEPEQPQRIDINRADLWLLQALPNIGEVRAQAIVDYRQQKGPFHNIEEVTKVPGISESTFEKIKPFITIRE